MYENDLYTAHCYLEGRVVLHPLRHRHRLLLPQLPLELLYREDRLRVDILA
jgi:hypothetical protein